MLRRGDAAREPSSERVEKLGEFQCHAEGPLKALGIAQPTRRTVCTGSVSTHIFAPMSSAPHGSSFQK